MRHGPVAASSAPTEIVVAVSFFATTAPTSMVVAVSPFVAAGHLPPLMESRTWACSWVLGTVIPLSYRNAANLRNSSGRRYGKAGAWNGRVLAGDVHGTQLREPT